MLMSEQITSSDEAPRSQSMPVTSDEVLSAIDGRQPGPGAESMKTAMQTQLARANGFKCQTGKDQFYLVSVEVQRLLGAGALLSHKRSSIGRLERFAVTATAGVSHSTNLN